MKILITGNMGYVGPVVAQRLRRSFNDATIVGFDLGYFGHCLTAAEAWPERLINQQIVGDVRTLSPEVLSGVDAIVHLAAISNDPMGQEYEAVTHQVNQAASIRLATMAKKAGVGSFVFASSCSVYGYAEGGARTEKDSLNPLTAYAKSKVGTEEGIRELADRNFAITSLRFPTACGMSPRLRLDLVLNDFVSAAVADGKIQILSDGSPWRPLIDVRDMARAIEWAVRRKSENGGDFVAVNAGRNECNHQVINLAKSVAQLIPNTSIEINKDAAPDKRSYKVNFDRYRDLAGDFLPQVDLSESIVELRRGLETMGFSDPNFRESSHMRLKVLAEHRQSGRLNELLEWQV